MDSLAGRHGWEYALLMSKPRLPAFDPADLTESNATTYPAAFRADNSKRWNRRLGDHVGLKNFA